MKKGWFLRSLLFILIATLSLGQLSAIYQIDSAKIYLFDIVAGALVVAGLYYFLCAKSFRLPKRIILFLFFAVFSIITLLFRSYVLSLEDFVLAMFYPARFVTYVLSAVVVFNMLRRDLLTKEQVYKAFFISAFFVSVAGFIQLVFLPDFTVLDPLLGWDPHKNRLSSTFFDPNFTGGYLALILIMSVGCMLFNKYNFKRFEVICYILVPLLALLFTFSRSSWGMFAVGILVFGFYRARWLLFLSMILAFLTYFVVPRVQTRISGVTDPADSAAFRVVSWKNALNVIEDNLFLGVGFNAYRYAQEEYGFFDVGSRGGHSGSGADSSFLLVLATTGVFGFAVFLLAYFYPIVSSKGIQKVLLTAAVLSLFLHSQFVNSFFYPQIMFVFMNLLCIL